MFSRRAVIALVLAVVTAAPAFGQTPPPPPKPGTPAPGKADGAEPLNPAAVEKLLKLAYSWRREGNYDAASTAFRGVLPNVQGDARRKIVVEMCDMYVLQGKYEKAIRFYQEEKMLDESLEVVARAGRTDDAVALAKKLGKPLLEGRVLEVLGKTDEALAAYEKAGAHRERGNLLMKAGKPKDAVKAYEAAKDDYLRGVALDAAGEAAPAKAAFEAAKAVEKANLEKLLLEAKDVKKKYDGSTEAVDRERLRHELSRQFGLVSQAYDRLALCHERTSDTIGAAKMMEVAVKVARNERDTLTDLGADKWGQAIAKQRELEARIARLEERLVLLNKAAGEKLEKAPK